MDCAQALDALGVADAIEIMAPHWEASCACLPEDLPAFLDPPSISELREFVRLPEAVDAVLYEAACSVAASPALLRLAWHCSRLLYEGLDYPGAPSTAAWPHPIPALGELSGAFYLLLGLDAVQRMRAVHERLGIPEAISRDSCSHYPTSLGHYHENHDLVGFAPRVVYWTRNHARGDLFRLGRLEYMIKPFRGPLVVYRHDETGAVVALAAAGTRFDEQGYLASDEQPRSVASSFVQTDEGVTGTPISPFGRAEARTVSLPRSHWQPVLEPGNTVLEVHIPAGGGMTPAHCEASMRQALEFFPRYFPEQPFAGFACGSWILNPELAQIYRPDSNMVLWQRELYLYPGFGGPGCLYFLYGRSDVDVETAARDTSLRRALCEHLSAGGRLLGGGMFLLTEEVASYGTQPYRRRWPEVEALLGSE